MDTVDTCVTQVPTKTLAQSVNMENIENPKVINNRQDDDGFKTVSHKKKRPNIIYGKGETVEQISAYIPNIDIHISRLSLDLEANNIISYLTKKFSGIKVICEDLPVKSKLYKSFKINVPSTFKKNIYDESIWPQGVVVKPFFQLRNKKQ